MEGGKQHYNKCINTIAMVRVTGSLMGGEHVTPYAAHLILQAPHL